MTSHTKTMWWRKVGNDLRNFLKRKRTKLRTRKGTKQLTTTIKPLKRKKKSQQMITTHTMIKTKKQIKKRKREKKLTIMRRVMNKKTIILVRRLF